MKEEQIEKLDNLSRKISVAIGMSSSIPQYLPVAGELKEHLINIGIGLDNIINELED